MSYLRKYSPLHPHQRQQLDEQQVQNSAGGYAYPVSIWTNLDRFLILGTEGGSYYAAEQDLTKVNVDSVKQCIAEDGVQVVERIRELSVSGRAPKNGPALYALALAFTHGNAATKQKVQEVFCDVARIGTHLFNFVVFIDGMRGWGRSLRRLIGDWYRTKDDDALAYQVLKYQSRSSWRHADVLAKCHYGENRGIYRWMKGLDTGKRIVHRGLEEKKVSTVYDATDALPELLAGYEELKLTEKRADVIKLIETHQFTHEMVPNQWKDDPDVWAALLANMPVMATVRNLGKMTQVGLLKPFAPEVQTVLERLSAEAIQRSLIHPIQILMALTTYKSGKGVKGSLTWEPVPQIVEGLDAAFYMAFDNVEPSQKNTFLALDVSGSMISGAVAGCVGLTPRNASAAMALVTARTEPNYHIFGFSDKFVHIPITATDRLVSAIESVSGLPHGRTNCSLPMLYAMEHKLEVDMFTIYTDSETWYGDIHPKTALDMYRQKMGRSAKCAIVAMVANNFSIADPKDAGMLDFVGFDTATPALLSDFAKDAEIISEDA
ncbi:MAG: TROVE domain-containing protein [Candidatus Poribacteria bacterium]|nr:TROVE domain-containing protein [Candidatus Poribacteria bacterium]